MPRKIASQIESEFKPYTALGIEPSRVLTESISHDGEVYMPGQLDPTYQPEPESLFLITLDGRRYDSIAGAYTKSKLPEGARFETKLDGDFTHTVLQQNSGIRYAWDRDPSYADQLGLPAYDPAVHVTDISIAPAHAEAQGQAWIAATEAYQLSLRETWIAEGLIPADPGPQDTETSDPGPTVPTGE